MIDSPSSKVSTNCRYSLDTGNLVVEMYFVYDDDDGFFWPMLLALIYAAMRECCPLGEFLNRSSSNVRDAN